MRTGGVCSSVMPESRFKMFCEGFDILFSSLARPCFVMEEQDRASESICINWSFTFLFSRLVNHAL